jgi:hypothetical protein
MYIIIVIYTQFIFNCLLNKPATLAELGIKQKGALVLLGLKHPFTLSTIFHNA